MTVEDLLGLEELGQIEAAPDGALIAAVVRRSRHDGGAQNALLAGNGRADIWMVSVGSGEIRRLADLAGLHGGLWQPRWSRSGRYLAMLSSEGGDNVRLHVWDRKTGETRRVSDRAIDLMLNTEVQRVPIARPLAWIGDSIIVCGVLPDGRRTRFFTLDGVPRDDIQAAWRAQQEGREATASVLESATGRVGEATQGEIALVHLKTGAIESLAHYPLDVSLVAGSLRQALPSPTAAHVALLMDVGGRQLQAGVPLRDTRMRQTRLGIVRLGAERSTKWVTGIEPRAGWGSNPGRWSPSSSHFGVIGTSTKDSTYRSGFFLVSPTSGASRRVTPSQFEAQSFFWVSDRFVVVRGGNVSSRPLAAGSDAIERADWWLLEIRGDSARLSTNLSRDLVDPPFNAVSAGESVFWVHRDKLWRKPLGLQPAQELAVGPSVRVRAIEWPSDMVSDTKELIVSGEEGGKNSLYQVRIDGSAYIVRRLERPAEGTRLASYDPSTGQAIYSSSGAFDEPLAMDGPAVWGVEERAAPLRELFRLNQALAGVARARRRLISYVGPNGDSLQALLLLPPEGTQGRWPLIAWVYGGVMVTDTVLWGSASPNTTHPLNMELLAARGYAVLIPSIPLATPGALGDPYEDIPKGVMGAIDRTVELGIADPRRLGVWGHSYGGYSTLALVTQTSRFRAAIVSAGLSDMASSYGAFGPWRYGERAHEELYMAYLAEASQLRMGSPPFANQFAYQANSPLSYAHRVETPVMFLHGDLDFVPIEQAEMFFTALVRQGKKARFVRYWGEGHVLTSPANIRDMWRRVLDWFDTELTAPPSEPTVGTRAGNP